MKKKNICKLVSAYTTGGFTITNFVFESNPQAMCLRATLKSNRLILVTSGEGSFFVGKDVVPVQVGVVVFCFKGEEFCVDRISGELEYTYIDFDGIRSGEIFNRFGIDEQNRHFEGFNGIIPLWKESLSHASTVTVDLAAESILLYTFSKFADQATIQDSTVGKMIEITKDRFSDPGLSISVLSQELSYNPKYLSYMFKRKMGIGYSEYLKNMRLKFAVSLFDNGVDSIKNVAVLSGFSDPLYFSTLFKKSMGISPKEYKNNLNKD